jgi:uncharacterized alpha-E superfamily protein
VQQYLTFEEANTSSLRRSVAAVRENARWARDVVTTDAFEALNELFLWFSSPVGAADYATDRDGFFHRVRSTCQLALGAIHGTMLHDDAYGFILLGVMLERAAQTARMLDVHHHALLDTEAPAHLEASLWLTLLRACSGLEPFLRSRGRATPEGVARFLVLDPDFPRSARHALRTALKRLRRLRPEDASDLPGGESLARLAALESWLSQQDPGALAPERMHALLTRVVDDTAAICELIGVELLGYPAPSAEMTAVQ